MENNNRASLGVISLCQLQPQHHLRVGLALALSLGLLLASLTQPILYTQQMLFWKQTYTVWTGIVDLWELGEYILAGVVFFFSIVFPFGKLLILSCVWFMKLSQTTRLGLIRWLHVFGKWSMLDVFVVAILIVLVKVGSLVRIEPRLGILFFCAAILGSMIITTYIERLALEVSEK